MIYVISGQEIRKGKNHRYVIGVLAVKDIDDFLRKNGLKEIKRLKSLFRSEIERKVERAKGFDGWSQDVIVVKDKDGRRYFLEKSKKIVALSK